MCAIIVEEGGVEKREKGERKTGENKSEKKVKYKGKTK